MVPEPIEADFEVDAGLAADGAAVYENLCFLCHGPETIAGGQAPDLRASMVVTQLEEFASVVRDGVRAVNGMPRYQDITYDQLLSLQHYIRDQAEVALATTGGGG